MNHKITRKITYVEALREAIIQEMERDNSVFVYGIDVSDHKAIFNSIKGIKERFGEKRCFGTPLSEDSLTGFGLGAAISGLRPINIHIRIDFMLLAMNQLTNMVSSYNYATNGLLPNGVPLTIRTIIGRGWGQGYQHSKSMFSTFAHIPGLKIVIPTTPYDAKGLLTSAIRDNNPVIVFEHRWLYWQEGEVPEEQYTIPIGKPNILKEGDDLTIIATSWMNVEAKFASEILKEKHNIDIEIIDPRTVSPLTEEFDKVTEKSIQKTHHCIIADYDWIHCGLSSELSSRINENLTCFNKLEKPIKRIGFANTPCPTVRHLENEFYPNAKNIIREVETMLELDHTNLSDVNFYSYENKFKGPF